MLQNNHGKRSKGTGEKSLSAWQSALRARRQVEVHCGLRRSLPALHANSPTVHLPTCGELTCITCIFSSFQGIWRNPIWKTKTIYLKSITLRKVSQINSTMAFFLFNILRCLHSNFRFEQKTTTDTHMCYLWNTFLTVIKKSHLAKLLGHSAHSDSVGQPHKVSKNIKVFSINIWHTFHI